MKLWRSLLGLAPTGDVEQRFWPGSFSFKGVSYPVLGVTAASDRETAENNFTAYVRHAYKSNGVVFACMTARQLIFSEARFAWQELRDGQPGDLFSTAALSLLERPWPNATTGELLSRMIQDADLAGNFYAVRQGGRLRRLRPDWVEIVLSAPPEQAVASDVVGYMYRPGGSGSGAPAETFLPDQIAHWSPIPDPESQYRGMSWLTPVLREVESDTSATVHKQRFFDNAATPNLMVTFPSEVTKEQFDEFIEGMDAQHKGAHNAYKTLYLGGGADVTVVGADMAQLDFKATQGAGETRIAAAARMHPVIVGLSEGLQGSSLNAGNFNSARRLVADGTLRPLWRSAASSLETLFQRPPSGARLWFDDRDIAFLREDRADVAKIQADQASAIKQLTEAGYEPAAVVDAVQADNMALLDHTGVFSVQLQPPTTGQQPNGDGGNGPDDGDGEGDDGNAA